MASSIIAGNPEHGMTRQSTITSCLYPPAPVDRRASLRRTRNDKATQTTTDYHEQVDSFAPDSNSFPVSNDASREKYRQYLTQKGLRVTNQRLAIYDAAFEQKEHFTAEQLLDYARAIDDSVSRATVYRSLPIMTESGILREVDIGSGEKFYLPITNNTTQVAQVVCVDCDKIFEISAPFMEWYGSTVSSKLGLTPVSQRLQVSAHCDSFRESGTCPRRG